MKMCRCDIATVCVGKAMSCGIQLLMSGTKGKRFITPNSRTLIHSVSSAAWGRVNDMDNEVEEVKRLQKMIEDMITKYTKINKSQLKELMSKDSYLTAKQSKDLGIVDYIIDTPKTLYSKITLS